MFRLLRRLQFRIDLLDERIRYLVWQLADALIEHAEIGLIQIEREMAGKRRLGFRRRVDWRRRSGVLGKGRGDKQDGE